jgi:GTP-binding protein YchF
MSFSIGIVGLPNVGKSTLFNALLKKQVALAANYPFATIEPNVGIAEVPDARLAELAKIVDTTVLKPATVEFVDIAGLVKGAAEGAGLGNKFLANIRETSAICHVLRVFTDDSILREGATAPLADLEIVRTELQLADLVTLEKQPQPKGTKEATVMERWAMVQEFLKVVSAGKSASQVIQASSNPELAAEVAKELCLLTAKPEIFVLNVDETELKNSAAIATEYAATLQVAATQIVVISAKIESELASLGAEDQALYLEDLGLTQSGLERLAAVAYKTLGLQSFLTAGKLEVKAWTITTGSKAPQAAAVIHTDFEKSFIKAKVASYADFIACKGWNGVREQGKLRLEGKDYVMQEGDVVEFMLNK